MTGWVGGTSCGNEYAPCPSFRELGGPGAGQAVGAGGGGGELMSMDSAQIPPPSHYLHGTAPEEQARLSRLNGLLNDLALREMGLEGGERILDVGCGLGQLSRAMARAAARPVVGIERSREQISEALRQAERDGESGLLDLREGDAVRLPLTADEWGAFDVAHTRFVLEHVTDPPAVV